jgi:hypothetical protein
MTVGRAVHCVALSVPSSEMRDLLQLWEQTVDPSNDRPRLAAEGRAAGCSISLVFTGDRGGARDLGAMPARPSCGTEPLSFAAGVVDAGRCRPGINQPLEAHNEPGAPRRRQESRGPAVSHGCGGDGREAKQRHPRGQGGAGRELMFASITARMFASSIEVSVRTRHFCSPGPE